MITAVVGLMAHNAFRLQRSDFFLCMCKMCKASESENKPGNNEKVLKNKTTIDTKIKILVELFYRRGLTHVAPMRSAIADICTH